MLGEVSPPPPHQFQVYMGSEEVADEDFEEETEVSEQGRENDNDTMIVILLFITT